MATELVSNDRGCTNKRLTRGFARLLYRSAPWLILSLYCAYAFVAFVRLSDHQGPAGGYDDWGYFRKAHAVRQWLLSGPGERLPFIEMAARERVHSPLHVLLYAVLLRSDGRHAWPRERTSQRTIQLFQLMLSAIALWIVYKVSLRLYSRPAAVIALALGALSFPVIAQSLMLLQHAISAMLLLVILWLLLATERFPELSVILTTLGSFVLAGFRYGYIYLAPVLLVLSGALAVLRLSQTAHRRRRDVCLLLTLGACVVAILVTIPRYRSYLAAVESVAYEKDLRYRVEHVVLDARTDACRWEPPSDTQSATWSEHLRLANRSLPERAAAMTLWHCWKLVRIVEGNLNLRRAWLWPFTLPVQRVIGVVLTFLAPVFLLISARLRRYELYLGVVGGYLVAMEFVSVIETRRLYDVLFVALPVTGAGVAGILRGLPGLWRSGRWVVVAGAAALCVLAFTPLGGGLPALHLRVRDMIILLALALTLASFRWLLPCGLTARVGDTRSGRPPGNHRAPAPSVSSLDRTPCKRLSGWRWVLVGAYLGALWLGFHVSRVRTLDWTSLRPGEEVSMEIEPFPEETPLRAARVADVTLLADVFAEGHPAGAPEMEYRLDLSVNGRPIKGQTPGLNPLFDPVHDGRRECAEARMLSVLSRHNAWHGLSWTAHRHWQKYYHVPPAWLAGAGRDTAPATSPRPIAITLRNSGRHPLRILRCLGDFTRPRVAWLPTVVAADGSQFRRGSAYAGSRLDDWRIPYKYEVSSALRAQTRQRPGGKPVYCSPNRFRYGVFLVLLMADGRRVVL
jgi:hypothetical protein